MRGVRRVRLAVHEQPFPDADIAADIEWKRHVVVARLAGHRRKRLQVGKEIADVLDRRMLVGRIWKGREIMRPSGDVPLSSAVTKSASLQRPIPYVGSDEMLGT
jgi:hypothetical protein